MLRIKTHLFLVVAGLLLASCSFESKTPLSAGIDQTLANQPTGRFFNYSAGGEPEYLDPALVSDNVSTGIALSLFEGLLAPDPKGGAPRPGVAKSWETSADRRTYTFHLRENARWSNGDPVTAQDFVYSWTRVLDPTTASSYVFIMYPIKNAKAYYEGTLKDRSQLGFKALDSHTLQVKLENPTPYFIELVSYVTLNPVHQATVEAHGPRWVHPEHMVSNGPFKMTEWSPNKQITVVKNEHYWDASSVRIPGIHFLAVEDRDTALKMYDSGQLDVLWNPPESKVPSLMSRPDFEFTPLLATYYYEINTLRPVFQDPRIRRALSYAINRRELCEKYLQKTKLPSVTLVPPYISGYKSPQGVGFDPEKAKKLLAEAGYTDPKTFPTISITYNTQESHKLIAQVIQSMWKNHLGINVTLQNEEFKSFLKTMRTKNFDIGRSGWAGDYADPNTFMEIYLSDSSQNQAGWKNDTYDQLVTMAWSEADTQKRIQYFQDAEKILLNEAPLIPLYTNTMAYLVQPYVSGYYPNPKDVHDFKGISLDENLLAKK